MNFFRDDYALVFRPTFADYLFSFFPQENDYAVKFKQVAAICNDSWVVDFRKYKFNTINYRKKLMFNYEEINFIKETAERDLNAVKGKIQAITHDLACLGKKLSDIKIVESHLISILQGIEDNESAE